MPAFEKQSPNQHIRGTYPAEFNALTRLQVKWGYKARMDVIRALVMWCDHPDIAAVKEEFHQPRFPKTCRGKPVVVAERVEGVAGASAQARSAQSAQVDLTPR
jgi:hypothetical protein